MKVSRRIVQHLKYFIRSRNLQPAIIYSSVSIFTALYFLVGGPYTNPVKVFFTDVKEDVMYTFFPSAERAYDYGDVHLNPNDPSDYDIARAEFFFNQARKIDPNLPYVYHQLARIAFLNSDFLRAMSLINTQIQNQGDNTPSSFYVRGLIEGYMGNYADAENDYAHFLKLEPNNWAGANDYAWVLLKDNKPALAAQVTSEALKLDPNNPWLLNSNATALYEIGDIADAKAIIERASAAVQTLTPSQWSYAYPGNNPDIAADGVASFQEAVADNMHRILPATTTTSH
ncbi:MAG TPA: tetratricopeptide repeat protein [Candidatus Paceibacterota bacterium]|nr:tetratricopeptide repeat protein [Candidatus Paceibacterota bacterium]